MQELTIESIGNVCGVSAQVRPRDFYSLRESPERQLLKNIIILHLVCTTGKSLTFLMITYIKYDLFFQPKIFAQYYGLELLL